MKETTPDDPTLKALRERYARLLGLNEDDFVVVTTNKKDKTSTRRYLFLFMLPLAVFGLWFVFSFPINDKNNTEPVPVPKTHRQQPGPAKPALPAEPEAGSTKFEPIISEPAAPDQPYDSDRSAMRRPDLSNQANKNKKQPEPIAQDFYLVVVVLSTTSKEEALERAKTLGSRSYPSEVILSSTGYYGVVLKHDTYEQAKASVQTIAASGIVKERPYIMRSNRVKEYIHLKAE